MPAKTGSRGRPPKIARPDQPQIRVDEYYKSLENQHFKTISVRGTAKGKLKAGYHFRTVYVLNKTRNTFVKRLVVIRSIKTKTGIEIKFHSPMPTSGNTPKKQLLTCWAQRVFVEHCIKECKQVLGLNQFQTRKWLAWLHQVAINIMLACFILKEKLHCFDDLPFLSAIEIGEWICFKLSQTLTDEEMVQLLFFRHLLKQKDINRYYKNEFINVSK